VGKTLSAGNDAQDESNQDLSGIVVIAAFGLVGGLASITLLSIFLLSGSTFS
jgi:hypothetical protein